MPVPGFLCKPAHEIVAGEAAGIFAGNVVESVSAFAH